MKSLQFLLLVSFVALAFSACKKDDPATEANITFKFEHFVDQTKIENNNPTQFINAAGNSYSVNVLKYYISNAVLIDAAGNETAFENHDLIDAFGVSEFPTFTVPNGDYVKMRFLFGVDAAHNTSGDQAGDLDPSNGMFWSWATGYIFMKHEGKYLDNNNNEQNLELHLGRQSTATEVEVALTNLKIEGKDKQATIRFNLNNMYNDPVIDFNLDNFRHSGSTETSWMSAMSSNLVDVFSYTGSNEL